MHLGGARRSCATKVIANLKTKEAEIAKMLPFVPDSLKPLFSQAEKMREKMETFSEQQPELLAEMIKRKEANPLATGIVATVPTARDPKTCKYTLEGTLVHTLMKDVYYQERLEKLTYDGLEVVLSPAHKAAIAAKIVAFGKDLESSAKATAPAFFQDKDGKDKPFDNPYAKYDGSGLPDKMPLKTVLGLA
eukprot:CAMPEP_0119310574 /NCGR_PEP_ID=MMETSP1333-20130426/19647_1 /TAXON_ID=418940 /ORGANISM="Scyphosphaera apsteinii, Strain RCC1455" /LENGTH=190 /DNA_ID=CAMNT_0007314789 /DNA_START=50 /DNA_END=622 /DNA_ORIENTATION=+